MKSLVWGAVGGGVAAGIVWFLANRAIDQQLRQGAAGLEPQVREAVQAAVPPAVRTELESTLRRYNITPETGQRISTLLNAAGAVGLVGYRRFA